MPSLPVSLQPSTSSHDNISVPQVSPWKERSLRRRSHSGEQPYSAAQRALGAIAGQSFPANPARILTPGTARSVPVPKRVGTAKLVDVSRNKVVRKTSHQFTTETARMLNIVEQFPLPPNRQGIDIRLSHTSSETESHAPFLHRPPLRASLNSSTPKEDAFPTTH